VVAAGEFQLLQLMLIEFKILTRQSVDIICRSISMHSVKAIMPALNIVQKGEQFYHRAICIDVFAQLQAINPDPAPVSHAVNA